jgi:cytochrome c-type biogenesis protein CcmF
MKKEELVFLGEQLIWGNIGNLAIAMAFATAFMAFLSYSFSIKNTIQGIVDWKKLGRVSFILHGLSVFTIIGVLFYILVNHRFEYQYAWQHTSKDLPFKYIFAAFWEGQEGSFLLWTFWLVVISFVLMFTAKEWEGRVMTIFAIVQMFLISMILGIVIEIPGVFDYKFGSNPFILFRENAQFSNIPILSEYTVENGVKVNHYLSKLDGRGLNPSLQNYWMTIHPPTLFLGFALTLVPYLFAVAGLWSGKLSEWTRPATPWAFVGVAILGGGVLMGGAWAYEALNFGGFWAWDPVENSSLVPWLTLVAAGHLMLVPKNKGVNLKAAIMMALLSFLLVLYSTFLTRSGVLGDASVHSFTDLGMTGQLLVYLFFFIALPSFLGFPKIGQRLIYFLVLALVVVLGQVFDVLIYLMLIATLFFLLKPIFIRGKNETYFPKKQDDHIYSREFWIFVGALIITASAVHLTAVTSIPVINKIFNTKNAPVGIDGYNNIQVIFALFITFFMAAVQFLRYKQEKAAKFWLNIIRSFIASLVLVIIGLLVFEKFSNPVYIAIVFTSIFAILGNVDYLIQYVKTNWKLMGPSIAHIGFGMIILGAVISAGHKTIISENNNGIRLEMLNEEFKNNENIMLHQHDTVQMGPYYLCFVNDTLKNNIAYYQIDYLQKQESGTFKKLFTLYPRLLTNERMGNVPVPSTKHFLHKDIFTHVTYVDLAKVKRKSNPNESAIQQEKERQHFTLEKGDTIFGTSFYIVFEGFEALSDIEHVEENQPLSVTLRGSFVVKNFKGASDTIRPIYEVKNNMLHTEKDFSKTFGIEMEVEKILDDKKIEVAMREVKEDANNFIIMQAIIFPGINILWTGCFLMVFGTFFAVIRRISLIKRTRE